MKNIAFILLILAAVCFANCAGDYEAEPRGTNDGKAPAPITNISVKNVNGGAIIKYTPSDDVDLLYVNLKSATKPLNVLIAFTRPLITEFADNLNLKHPLLPTISPYPTM